MAGSLPERSGCVVPTWSLGVAVGVRWSVNTDLNATNRTRAFRTLKNLGDQLAQPPLRRKQAAGLKWLAEKPSVVFFF